MAVANKVSLKDNEVQKNLQANVGRIVAVRGTLKAGDPINPLTGEALQKDIDFQKKTQHRKFVIKDEHFKFSVDNAVIAKPEDGKKTAAESYVAQQIYGDDNILTVETRSNRGFAMGYEQENGKIKLINREAINGKKFAHGQEVIVNYRVYQQKDSDDCGVGFENIVFVGGQPKFWESTYNENAVGAFSDWDTEADDLGAAETVKPEPKKDDEEPAGGSDNGGDAVDWENQWE